MLFDPNRGRLLAPNLDDRSWSDLVSDAIALIPQYAKQWTNQSPSDVGITLIELFAWLVEGLTYRLNQVPDKNYIAFLNLLGITRVPPDPARAFPTFTSSSGSALAPRGTQIQTAASETQTPVIFETDSDLSVLPINLQCALQISKVFFNKYTNISPSFTQPPAPGATINVPPGQSVQLCLGFDNSTVQTIDLMVRMFAPLAAGPMQPTVTWLYSTGSDDPSSWSTLPVVGAADGTEGLTQDGVVQLTVPGDWASQAPSVWGDTAPASTNDTVITAYYWIGIRIANIGAEPVGLGLSWMLINSVSAYSALTIAAPEALGAGDGTPFQTFDLANGPLFNTPGSTSPYSHLVVSVNGVTWTQVDDFPSGPGQIYRIDPVQAQVMFGDYDALTNTGHGTVPQTADAIVAVTYRYVASGAAGNVGAGSLIALNSLVSNISGVTNLFAAYGGSDAEAIEETMRRAPQLLRNRDRAVTVDDYQVLALQASSEVAIAGCLPPTAVYGPPPTPPTPPYGNLYRTPGCVNVIVVPGLGPDVSAQPTPTPELIQTVVTYLDARRDVTALLNVTGPRYVPIDVVISASPWASAISSGLISGPGDMQVYIENLIGLFLHPVVGGPNGEGWQIGQNVFVADLYKAVMPPEAMGYISDLAVAAGPVSYPGGRPSMFPAPYNPPPSPPPPSPANGAWVRLADFELACLGQIYFNMGAAT